MNDEIKRIEYLLRSSGVDEARIELLHPIIENAAYMREKLDGAMDAIKGSQVAISYDNGGGQKGIRENPVYKGYEALWKSYIAGMKLILDEMPECEAKKEEEQKPQNMIEILRARKSG